MGIFEWLVVLIFLILLPYAKTLAEIIRNYKDGGGNPPDHPLPATGLIEKTRRWVNDDKPPRLT
jgi:hypothetical protein